MGNKEGDLRAVGHGNENSAGVVVEVPANPEPRALRVILEAYEKLPIGN